MAKEMCAESMNASLMRYNCAEDTDVYTGSEVEQAIQKSSKKLKYNKINEDDGYVYEIGYDDYWKEQVIFKYPFLWKRGLEEPTEEQKREMESMRVVEWH